MWLFLVATVLAAPISPLDERPLHPTWVTHGDIKELLELDDALLTISKKLADIDAMYEFIENDHTGENPYPWETRPNRPTLRDRRKALRGAQSAIAQTMTGVWVP